MGGDLFVTLGYYGITSFNPRRPCGRRPHSQSKRPDYDAFQSAPPVWAATNHKIEVSPITRVSIRAARVGGDRLAPV